MNCKVKDGKYVCVRYKYSPKVGEEEKKLVEAGSPGARIKRENSGAGKKVLVC